MRRFQKCAVGVLIVAALSVTVPAFASAPSSDNCDLQSLLSRFKTWIVRAVEYNGVSLPPG